MAKYLEEEYLVDEDADEEIDDAVSEEINIKIIPQDGTYNAQNLSDRINKGTLITNPDYQRDFIYNEEKQSKLIESILLQVPIPTVYLVKVKNNRQEVIDGQQRIRSIVNFYNNNFALKGLTVLKELNKLHYRDLPEEYANIFDDFQLRYVSLVLGSEEFKYDIFSRLNQGAVALNPQEIRNCIYRGPFNTLLHELAKDQLVEGMFNFENKRMKYEELILRFFALKNSSDYGSSIDKASNNYMAKNRDLEENKKTKLKNLFKTTLKMVKTVLGPEAFYGFNRDTGEIVKKFSPTVYDSIMLAFASFKQNAIISRADDIRSKIYDAKKNDERYKLACYAATGSRKNVFTRVKTIERIISGCLTEEDYGDRLFDPKLKQELFYKGYICKYCGNEILSPDDAEIDHIKPYSMGGKTILENAQLLHAYCNHSKSNKE